MQSARPSRAADHQHDLACNGDHVRSMRNRDCACCRIKKAARFIERLVGEETLRTSYHALRDSAWCTRRSISCRSRMKSLPRRAHPLSQYQREFVFTGCFESGRKHPAYWQCEALAKVLNILFSSVVYAYLPRVQVYRTKCHSGYFSSMNSK